jgi:hypothetical protein
LIADAKLDANFPLMLGVSQSDSDGDCLLASMKRGTAKPGYYRLALSNTAGSGLSLERFCELVEQLSCMEGGLVSATQELSFQIGELRRRGSLVPEAFGPLSRRLLSRVDFSARDVVPGGRKSPLAEIAFEGPSAADFAAEFAARFVAAMDRYRAHGEEYSALACALFKFQPLVALDAFFGRPRPNRRAGLRATFAAHRGPVVECAPHNTVLEWVSAAPEVRAPVVAREVSFLQSMGSRTFVVAGESNGMSATLNPLAAGLLKVAPDKAAVLEGFAGEFATSYFVGNLGQSLAPHMAVLKNLCGETDPVIATWARWQLESLERRVSEDRTVEAGREASFE